MNISTLKSLVSNGWNISNRRELGKLIGEDEMKKLTEAYQELCTYNKRHDCYVPSLAGTGHSLFIPSGSINLSKRDGNFLMSISALVNDLFVPKTKHKFVGKEIKADVIKNKIKNFEQKVVDYFKTAKELPESALESKTMAKLYTSEFATTPRINEDGYYVTTLINRKTGKPEEAYVRLMKKVNEYEEVASDDFLSDEIGFPKIIQREYWGIFVKNSEGKYELVGKRFFGVNKEQCKITSDWMDSEAGSDLYEGIGLRAHQIGVERMMQENFDTVSICAEAQAFPFHYKSGFRVVPSEVTCNEKRFNDMIKVWMQNGGFDAETCKKAMVYRVEGDKYIVNTKSLENLRKLLYLKNQGKYFTGDTPMELHGEWLAKWKEMAQAQPIMLGVK